MNDARIRTLTGPMKVAISMARTHYGTRQPQIEIRTPTEMPFRDLRAGLHYLAATVELATPPDQHWIVQIEAMSDHRGRVYLELVLDSDAEAERGIALLRRFCDGADAVLASG